MLSARDLPGICNPCATIELGAHTTNSRQSTAHSSSAGGESWGSALPDDNPPTRLPTRCSAAVDHRFRCCCCCDLLYFPTSSPGGQYLRQCPKYPDRCHRAPETRHWEVEGVPTAQGRAGTSQCREAKTAQYRNHPAHTSVSVGC